MLTRSIHLLRQIAALLVTTSGLWQIAGLWLHRLDTPTLLTALSGSAYLLTGVGLFGQSRFTLFVGVALPACMLWLGLASESSGNPASTVRMVTDLAIVVLCGRVLWAVRHQPSV